MPSTPKLVSIVVPFFNEEEGVDFFYDALCSTLDQLKHVKFEVVCVNDGSRDGTQEKLQALTRRDDRFVAVELSRNFGKEAALSAGLDAAIGDAVIPMDADLQDPPALIGPMIERWLEGYDTVLARRTDRSTDSFAKRTTAQLFYRIHNRFSSVQLPDNVGDFRLMDRSVVEAIRQLPERQRFMKGLFAWVGFRACTIDYARQVRVAGSTKFSGWRLWNFALEGITSFSAAPLKLWTYIGGLGAGLSLLYALFIVLRTVVEGVDLPGYASLFVAVVFFGSVQLLSIGILGEYIGRIYIETKRRPLYVVRSTSRAAGKDRV